MSDANILIERFQKMASDDPTNELGHFSLGKEYLAAGRAEDAVTSLERSVEINPNLTKAYQLIGTALLQLGQKDRAIERLTEGAKRADERGDRMPRDEMARMLKDLGAPVPEFKAAAAPAPQVGEGQVQCKRCGNVGARLKKPPFKNAFGQAIYDNICYDCWQLAIRQGTKVINELRLPLNDPQAQSIWDQHIKEFLNLQE